MDEKKANSGSSTQRDTIYGKDVLENDINIVVLTGIPGSRWPGGRDDCANSYDLPAGNAMVKEAVEIAVEKDKGISTVAVIKNVLEKFADRKFLVYLKEGKTKVQLSVKQWKNKELHVFTPKQDRATLEHYLTPPVKTIKNNYLRSESKVSASSMKSKRTAASAQLMPSGSDSSLQSRRPRGITVDDSHEEGSNCSVAAATLNDANLCNLSASSFPQGRPCGHAQEPREDVDSHVIAAKSVDALIREVYERVGVETCLKKLENAQRDHDRETWSFRWALALDREEPEALDLLRNKRTLVGFLRKFCSLCTQELPMGIREEVDCMRAIRSKLSSGGKTHHIILRMLAVCLPMDRATSLVLLTNVPRNSRGWHWYAEAHTDKMRKAKAISQTCRGAHSMNRRYLWLADALMASDADYEVLTEFLKPTLSPLIAYSLPDSLSEDDKVNEVSDKVLTEFNQFRPSRVANAENARGCSSSEADNAKIDEANWAPYFLSDFSESFSANGDPS
jgi:hypothetical protein